MATEFCCRSGGNNLNAGAVDGSSTEPATTPLVSYPNGGWDATTDIFTAAAGAVMTEAVVGRFASLSHDADTNPTTNQFLVARITAVNAGTRQITLSTTARSLMGTEVATSATGRTLRIGGAWKGPNGAIIFPFGFISGALVNVALAPTRVNMKNDASYLPTASCAHAVAGPILFQGYTSTYGDKGKATLDAGGNAVVIVNVTVAQISFADIIFTNNGASGTSNGFTNIGGRAFCLRCIAYNIRGNGLAGTNVLFFECEAYQCNKSFTAGQGGFGANGQFFNCISHRNTGSANCAGFMAPSAMFGCIAADNSGSGVQVNTATQHQIRSCEFYNNAVSGIAYASASVAFIANCSFVKNTGYGINCTASVQLVSQNNGFGQGTMANTLGTINPSTAFIIENNTVLYASNVTPWVDPANGDYDIILDAARNAGYSEFPEHDTTYTAAANTIGYPDIGAAQHQDMSVQPTYGVGI